MQNFGKTVHLSLAVMITFANDYFRQCRVVACHSFFPPLQFLEPFWHEGFKNNIVFKVQFSSTLKRKKNIPGIFVAAFNFLEVHFEVIQKFLLHFFVIQWITLPITEIAM